MRYLVYANIGQACSNTFAIACVSIPSP